MSLFNVKVFKYTGSLKRALTLPSSHHHTDSAVTHHGWLHVILSHSYFWAIKSRPGLHLWSPVSRQKAYSALGNTPTHLQFLLFLLKLSGKRMFQTEENIYRLCSIIKWWCFTGLWDSTMKSQQEKRAWGQAVLCHGPILATVFPDLKILQDVLLKDKGPSSIHSQETIPRPRILTSGC